MAINCPKCDSENTDTARFCSNCATPLEPSKDIEVTKTLETSIEQLTLGSNLASRYQIIEELVKGDIGTVNKVHNSEIKDNVALTLLKPELEE